ncbi:PH domain-containing protein [Paraliobacillus sediminis]|uniref:PH domain-containing protein n=1 Tax=Paraliobacillus sediminis TaxID=1885916 RepID=UPI000E3E822C|nr:PH domain-containing protein [Paraliobacillus sediminis]
MIFRSKVDSFFILFISIVILIIGVVTSLSPLIDKEASISIIIIMFAIFITSVGLILWSIFFIQYIFYEDYLLVKGGPFRSKIPYQAITKISLTKNIFTGYRISSSKKALELFYSSAILGSIKISPKNKSEFITELKKRCPNAEIQE